MPPRAVAASLLAALVVGVAGCGAGAGGEEADVRYAVSSYIRASAAGNGEQACAYYTPALRAEMVRLQAPNVRLDVGYGAVHGPALTLGVALQERGEKESRSLGTLQRLSGVPEHPSRDWVIETDADVERALERVSEQLRTIEPLVAGDPAAFAGMRRRGSELLAEVGLEEDLRTARPEAREAFKARDFERVVSLLDPLEGHLRRHEQGWLDYARRELGRA